jgi:transcription initiation factor TFIIIB Brf1 subunit/transcription initiation factor TFIIB
MRIRTCPKCGSREITLDTGGQTGKWLCKKCGYLGALVIEEER